MAIDPKDFMDPAGALRAKCEEMSSDPDPVDAAMARLMLTLTPTTAEWMRGERDRGTKHSDALMGLTKAFAMDFASIMLTSARDDKRREALLGFGQIFNAYITAVANHDGIESVMEAIRRMEQSH